MRSISTCLKAGALRLCLVEARGNPADSARFVHLSAECKCKGFLKILTLESATCLPVASSSNCAGIVSDFRPRLST